MGKEGEVQQAPFSLPFTSREKMITGFDADPTAVSVSLLVQHLLRFVGLHLLGCRMCVPDTMDEGHQFWLLNSSPPNNPMDA
ncbi:hypothetical protein Pyn_30617 [Prunus yedoensis var. nudiflora]|uniref:Uncharacterized protein n=1 Tax=Prunus yedoensis var. nudiflora TaxID=2094558 RepID=A0A314UAB0_PRUYE|nr:hypothetical protein Pyn_30617 [Prunus yedoensis var. nudiflora]